ncbi:unnamed protein product, partial [Gulo gulo]
LKEDSQKLKHLEVESSPLLTSRPNIDVNINNQEEVVKLTEKCLNNAIESPGLNARRVPPDLKSNILKAQVEAVHKVTREDSLSHKNTSVQDASTNRYSSGLDRIKLMFFSSSLFFFGLFSSSPVYHHIIAGYLKDSLNS